MKENKIIWIWLFSWIHSFKYWIYTLFLFLFISLSNNKYCKIRSINIYFVFMLVCRFEEETMLNCQLRFIAEHNRLAITFVKRLPFAIMKALLAWEVNKVSLLFSVFMVGIFLTRPCCDLFLLQIWFKTKNNYSIFDQEMRNKNNHFDKRYT